MRVALALIVACAALVQAHPEINCGTFHCTAGWRRKTSPDPFNIACLGGACTNEVCCNPPTCESVRPFSQLTCIFKANAAQIQCPGSSADGCDARVCCARNQTVVTPAPTNQPTQRPTNQPTQVPTQRPTQRPTNQPTQSPTAAPTVGCAPGWSVYFCNYQKDVRVRKMRLNFNEQSGIVSLIAGSIVNVSRPGGGDGIIVNPQNDRELFVGGQQERIFIINTSNPNIDTNWGRQFTTGTRVFHVAAIDSTTIIGSHVDGWNNVSYSKLVGGTLPDKSTATVIPVTGAAPKVVSVIPVSNGRIVYTTSTENGEPGNVGFCTITSTALNTQAPFLTNVRAHAGVYQASTDSLFVWGDKVVSQYDLTTGALKATRDVTALIGTDLGSAGARHVDNGVLFQDRWLLIVANAGKLLWFDLKASASGLLSQATAGSFIVTGADEFDSLTIPVCHA